VVRYEFCAGGNNSVVECDLAKVEVAGSNPVSRSNLRCAEAWSVGSHTKVNYGWHAMAKVVPPTLAERAKADQINDADIRSIDALSSLDLDAAGSSDTQFQPAPSPSGKAEVCKTSIPGSNPGGASNPKFN
jgi:hypothetical protein